MSFFDQLQAATAQEREHLFNLRSFAKPWPARSALRATEPS